MKRDYIITFITEFIVLASGILVYKLAANFLGKDGFSEYALSRRTVSLIQPALLLGLGVGIPRYLAYAHTDSKHKNPDGYFMSGLIILSLMTLVSALMLIILRDKFAFLLFGSLDYSSLIWPIVLMFSGLVLHSLCYSYFRGRLMMLRANFLQIINLGFIPLVVFLFFSKTTKGVLLATGIIWCLVSIPFLFSIIIKLQLKETSIWSNAKELLNYGIRRVPGDLGIAALLTLPATFTAHIAGIKEAGFVAFGVSVLNMIGGAFAPVGIILLPRASQLIVKRDMQLLRKHTIKILKAALILTGLGVVLFEIFATQIIGIYLGEEFLDSVNIVRIIVAGAIAYVVYISTRSIIDAYYIKAVNTRNILISLLIFIVCAGLVSFTTEDYIHLSILFVITVFILGGLTLLEVKKLLRHNDGY